MKSCLRYTAWAVAVCAVATMPAASQKMTCGREEALRADHAIDGLKTWESVHQFYKRFLPCDDGGISEGVSDKVAKLLANRWDQFNEFMKLASNDKGFEDFVVRHVDETIDWRHDAPKIHENARQRCPSNSARLCKALIAQTTPGSTDTSVWVLQRTFT